MRGTGMDVIWAETVSLTARCSGTVRSEAARCRTASPPSAFPHELLADPGVLARGLQGGMRLGHVAAGHEQCQGILVLGRPALKRRGAVNHAGDKRIAAPVLGRGL